MNGTAPECTHTRTVQALVAEHPAGSTPTFIPSDMARPPQSSASKRMFRRSSTASEPAEEKEGGDGQQQEAMLEARPPSRRPLAERVAAIPSDRLQRWLSNAV